LAILTGLLACGCARNEWQLVSSAKRDLPEPSASAPEKADPPAATADDDAAGDAELAALFDKLKSQDRLDGNDEAQLLDDLKSAPDSMKPLLARNLRALLARNEPSDGDAAGPATAERKTPPRAKAAGHDNPLRDDFRRPAKRPAVEDRTASHEKPRRDRPPAVAVDRIPADVEPATDTDSKSAVKTGSKALPETEDPAYDAPPDPPVKQASHTLKAEQPPKAVDWHEHLNEAIRALEHQTSTPGRSDDDAAHDEALLRLLYLAAGRRADAAKPIEQLDPHEQQFWSHQTLGLGIYLDKEGMPITRRRSALALRELRDAASQLAATSTLDVRNLAFCKKVDCYGRYSEFPKYEFVRDQEVLLYVEIDNFTARQTADGFETAMQGSYEIFDSGGSRVDLRSFPLEKETCRNRRRDYFIPYRMWIPRKITPGDYTLQLTVEDTHGQKLGQSSIRFKVMP